MNCPDLIVVHGSCLGIAVGVAGTGGGADFGVGAGFGGGAVNLILGCAGNLGPGQLGLSGAVQGQGQSGLSQIAGPAGNLGVSRVGSGGRVNCFDLVIVGLAGSGGGVRQTGAGDGGQLGISAGLGGGAPDFVLCGSLDFVPGQLDLAGGGNVGNLHHRPGQITGSADYGRIRRVCRGIAVDGSDLVVIGLTCGSTGVGQTGAGNGAGGQLFCLQCAG